MSRGRRQVIQIDEPQQPRVLYSNEPTNDIDDDDNDSAGDMPTPERLVTEDMLPSRPAPSTGARGGFEIDNKVANFLAEIDALEPGAEVEAAEPQVLARNQEISPPARDQYTPPPRERSPVRSKPNAYSNMFVKGTPEFVKKPDDPRNSRGEKKLEPWPEEPKTDWQQLTDEKSNYPYYWNMVTNGVVWDMPAEFSQYLLRQKEYEEKVERGLREGTLNPDQRGKPFPAKQDKVPETKVDQQKVEERPSKSHVRHGRRHSHSEDSSSDSSDSDGSQPRKSLKNGRKSEPEKSQPEVSSSSADSSRAASQLKRSATPELPDSTRPDDKKITNSKNVNKDESIDFDIDDIDKELEMALERKRQELMKLEEKKPDEKPEKDKHKDRKKDEHRHRDDDRKDDKHRKYGRHRDSERDRDHDKDRDRDRDRKHHHDREEKKPKLTLKERLRIEMELKMEKERRKKRAIEELMARELEQTVGRGSHKRQREEKPHKRYRYDDDRGDYRSGREEYGEYSREYDTWDDRGASSYGDRFMPSSSMKPPPPTDEMIAYEEERRSQVVDYGHGRSSRHDRTEGSDPEELRSADAREMEMKKLESLELAELALSKLEFLEVTKKGLSKLQILLIELETRHQDWQSGGLTTNHFLGKLREANWQLEQYEGSAAPTGWVCSWDRDYRRYFYTHKLTGKTQWDYPDADDIKKEDEKAQEPKKALVKGREPESEISSTSDKGKGRNMEKDILASMSLPPPPPPPAEEHPSVKSLQLMYGSSSESETEEPSNKKIKKEPVQSDLLSVPLPPEEPRKEKEKKDKHKKKKKKEKSKKKEKEKTEAGVMGPVGPVYPQAAAQPLPVQTSLAPPPPPPEEKADAYMSTAAPQTYASSAGQEQQTPMEVPVYGSVEDGQSGLNDQPLEFGSVQEPTGTHPYAETMDGTEQGVISQGPQMNTVSHEPETYNPVAYDAYGSSEPASEAMAVEGTSNSEFSSMAAPNVEEKKKKKKEKMGSGSISLKKKHVSSMVQKWQKVKKEVELEEQHRQIREAEIRRKLAELE